jgi:hypothetical protein
LARKAPILCVQNTEFHLYLSGKDLKFDHDIEISEGKDDGVTICLQNGKWNKVE